MILQVGSDFRELHGKAQHFGHRSFVCEAGRGPRARIIDLNNLSVSTRQFHLCSTYQHGKYNAGVRTLELPRVSRDSTLYGTGETGRIPGSRKA